MENTQRSFELKSSLREPFPFVLAPVRTPLGFGVLSRVSRASCPTFHLLFPIFQLPSASHCHRQYSKFINIVKIYSLSPRPTPIRGFRLPASPFCPPPFALHLPPFLIRLPPAFTSPPRRRARFEAGNHGREALGVVGKFAEHRLTD